MSNLMISEIMERDTYYLNESETIGDALEYLYTKEVSAVPVVNDDMEVVGYISDADIIKHISRKSPSYFGFGDGSASVEVSFDRDGAADKLRELLDMNIMTIASHRILTILHDTDIELAAEIMTKKKLKKIAIVDDDDRLAGVITRWTIVNHLLGKALRAADYR